MRSLAIVFLVPLLTGAQDGLPAAFWQAPLVRHGEYVLWHDPGPVDTLDFRYGIGGEALVPKPPFTFSDEDSSGTTPKIKVKDANGRSWSVKFGPEASPDAFCTRIAWACGYYAEPEYFVGSGVVQGVHNLQRAAQAVGPDGRFEAARFQLRARDPKFLSYVSWSWTENPFLDTPELNGLKVLLMLLSDWDNKDVRDAEKRGTNTAVYQHDGRFYFFIDDWGGSLGRWGKYWNRSKWNAATFLKQSADFVSVRDGELRWGYVGQHSDLLKKGPKPSDIQWLLQRLGRITDEQLRVGLISCGASESETATYVTALRARIDALKKVSASAGP